MTDLKIEASALRDWAVHSALPFWAENGRDVQGGFYEDLDLSGAPIVDSVRRVRVQARQIYVYAMAMKLGWYDGQTLLETTFDFMCEKGLSPDGSPGFVHRIDADYSIKSNRRDFYDHAFFLLSCAWLYRTTKDPKALELIAHIQTMMNTDMDSQTGGWLECVPDMTQEQLPRRQNPHMHFLEASMALYDTTADPVHLKDAHTVYDLFKSHFFDSDYVIIREFFDENWSRVKGPLGDTAEPGHAAEWIWLLWEFEKRSGISTAQYANALYAKCLQPGLFLNDEEDFVGKVRRGTKRLWVQTELIKAHLAQMERGIEGAEESAAQAIKAFREVYLLPNGTWVDQIDRDGIPCAKTVPTSSFYHILCMASEAVRLAEI